MAMDAASRVSVLVADDHALVRDALLAFLEGADGVEVVGTARDGVEAVAVALERHPRVVVMDVSMPKMDGVEATRRILHNAPETRIVILTGLTTRDSAEEALRAGAVAYVRKDREASEIFDAIPAATATW
jgi:DNA-binding NarL/FixJ family response regulator